MNRYIYFFTQGLATDAEPEAKKDYVNAILKREKNYIQGPRGKYHLYEFLVSGGNGDIFKAEADSGERFSLKVQTINIEAVREIAAYIQLIPLCGAYILCLRDYFIYETRQGSWIVLVQPLMQGDLLDLTPESTDVGNILLSLLLAVDCLHSQNIAHMDIKPDNVFYKTDLEGQLDIRLADPGLACSRYGFDIQVAGYENKFDTCVIRGTYIPPNYFYEAGKRLGSAIPFKEAITIDLWCTGLVLFNILEILGFYPTKEMIKLDESNIEHLIKRNYSTLPLEKRIKKGDIIDTKMLKDGDMGLLSQKTVERALSTLLNYQNTNKNARDIIYQIIRDENWAPATQEAQYFQEELQKPNDCQRI